jgi:DNA-binding winged helix-turn-helix (wHTH) protein
MGRIRGRGRQFDRPDRVLGQEPGGENWIETLPRRGYSYIGSVGEAEDD